MSPAEPEAVAGAGRRVLHPRRRRQPARGDSGWHAPWHRHTRAVLHPPGRLPKLLSTRKALLKSGWQRARWKTVPKRHTGDQDGIISSRQHTLRKLRLMAPGNDAERCPPASCYRSN